MVAGAVVVAAVVVAALLVVVVVVVELAAEVVELVKLVDVVEVELVAAAAAKKSAWLTLMGVCEVLHAWLMILYTADWSPGEDRPMHAAAFVMKFPPLRHRHEFVADTVLDSHLELTAAWLRQFCDPEG